MAKDKSSVQFYYDYIEQLEDLDDTQFRQVVIAMVEYDKTGMHEELDKLSKMAFKFIQKRIDYDKQSYLNKCKKNKENIQKYWNERKKENTNEYERNQMYTKNTDIDIELDIDKDIDITTTSNNIFEYVEKNFGRLLNPIEYEQINQWEDNELTRYAIQQAVLNNKYSINYINGILRNFKANNIKTVAEAQNQKTKDKNIKPEWIDKKIEKEVITEDEQKELEELLNEYKN